MPPLTINGNKVDLASIPPPGPGEETDFILVETTHQLQHEEQAQLESTGVQVLRRESDLVLLCRFGPPVARLPDVQALPFVTHAVVYHSDLVVYPEVWAVCRDSDSAPEAKKTPVKLVVYTHPTPEGGEHVFRHIQEYVDPDARLIRYNDRRAVVELGRLDKAAVREIARLDYVASMSLYRTATARCFVATKKIAPATLLTWPRPSPGTGNYVFDGTGETIAVVDSGLGDGRNTPPAFTNRLAAIVNPLAPLPGSLTASQRADTFGHGTEVACCACGSYSVPSIPNYAPVRRSGRTSAPTPSAEDEAAKNRCRDVRGSAPGARLVMIRVTDAAKAYHIDPPDDMSLPSIRSFDPKIFNFSVSTRNEKTINGKEGLVLTAYGHDDAMSVDEGANQDLQRVIVYSAGNEGYWPAESNANPANVLWRQITTQAAAKNCITVGATTNLRQQRTLSRDFGDSTNLANINATNAVSSGDVGNDQQTIDGWTRSVLTLAGVTSPLSSFGQAYDYNTLSLLSSRGPTTEGRIKPDVVAPGSMILAMRSRVSPRKVVNRPRPNEYRSCAPPFSEFSFSNGTSFSAPLVTGIAADLRQALREVRSNTTPSGALIKAMIVNGAIDLGNSQTHASMLWFHPTTNLSFDFPMARAPNCAQGFGLVDLSRSLRHVRDGLGGYIESRLVFTATATQPVKHEIDLPLSGSAATPLNQVLRITLAWPDPPGVPIQNPLVFSATCTPTAPGGAAVTVNRDPTRMMPWEAHDLDRPAQDEPNPNLQRMSIPQPQLYNKVTVQVARVGNLPLIPYIAPAGAVGRADQPFALAWALFDEGT